MFTLFEMCVCLGVPASHNLNSMEHVFGRVPMYSWQLVNYTSGTLCMLPEHAEMTAFTFGCVHGDAAFRRNVFR